MSLVSWNTDVQMGDTSGAPPACAEDMNNGQHALTTIKPRRMTPFIHLLLFLFIDFRLKEN
ncbi:hypothetical protein [Burkholderia ubonensis]|uniref:hypothetical protein n=1 Tax=Burkholderia ubonensis TaxID=101571 RepID=UPI000ADA654E|nr:hypothetical protein [Burkholderia ubonensis]